MHQLSGRFNGSELTNKLVDSETEVERGVMSNIEVFKKVVTGDEMSVEEKQKKRYTIKPFCKLIFGTNNLPELTIDDDGYYRRLNIIPFNKKISDDEENNFDKRKILNQEAIDYLANMALREYRKMLPSRKFANEKESKQILGTYRKAINSVKGFLQDEETIENTFSQDNRIPKTAFYGRYVGWCKSHKAFIKPKKEFYYEVLSHTEYVETMLDGKEYFKNTNMKNKEELKKEDFTF